MKAICQIFTITILSLLNISLSVAQNNNITIGGGPGELKIFLTQRGKYHVQRESFPGSGIWQDQFYTGGLSTPNSYSQLFVVKIGNNKYASWSNLHFTRGNDVINIVGTRGEYSKTFSGIHSISNEPYSIVIKIIYDTSNPAYFILEATINADAITTGEDITLGLGYDSFVNDCDGGAAWILPDPSGYNGIDAERSLTAVEVSSLQFVGGLNDRGIGSLMGFFPINYPFDRASSTDYMLTDPQTMVDESLPNSFKFGPATVPNCDPGGEWDNGVGIAYDNIPTGTTTVISTGLTFTTSLEGTLDYKWDNVKSKTATIGSTALLNLIYNNLGPGLLSGVAFRTNFPGLSINSSCTMGSWLSGTSDCTTGNSYYKLSNASVVGSGTATVDVPITVEQYGQWEINAGSISETAKTLPVGTPAVLTAPTEVNISAVSTSTICSGGSINVTVKLDGTATTSKDIVVDIDYTGTTAIPTDYVSLPPTVTIPANSNSATFTITTTSTATNGNIIKFTLFGTDKTWATIGSINTNQVSILQSLSPTLTSPLTESTCSGATFVYNMTSLTAISYSWSRAAVPGISNSAGSGTGTSLAETLINTTSNPINVVYEITMTTASGCSNTQEVVVTVNPDQPFIGLNDITACSGVAIPLSIPNPIPGATYDWYSGGNFLHSGTSFILSPLGASTAITVAVSGTACPVSSSSKVFTISINSAPTINVSDVTICSGSTATLVEPSPVAGATYKWYSGLTLVHVGTSYTTPILTANASYTVEISGVPCSPAPKTVSVTITNAPTINVNDVSTCSGQTVTLVEPSPFAGATYKWYSGSTLVHTGTSYTTPVLTADASYTVEMSGVLCPPAPKTVSVTIASPQAVNVSDVTICSGSTATLVEPSPVAGATYKWYSGLTLVHVGTSYTTPVLTADASYTVEMSGVPCPPAPKTVNVNVINTPTINVSDQSTCFGQTVTLVEPSPVAGATYKWYFGSTLVHTGTSYTTPVLTADASYTVEMSGVSCLPASKAVHVTVASEQTINIDDVVVCEGSVATLGDPSPIAGATYNWYSGSTLLHSGSSFTSPPLNASKTYTVEVTGVTCLPNPNTKVVTVAVNSIPTIEVSDVSICEGSKASLTVTNPISGATYNWYSGSTLVSTGNEFRTPELTGNTSYRVEATGIACLPPPKTVNIAINPLPQLNYTASADKVCYNSSALILMNGVDVSHTYNVYEDAQLTKLVASVAGSQANAIDVGFPLKESTTYYIQSVCSNGCLSPVIPVSIEVVNLKIEPDKLPRCIEGLTYSTQLNSNADLPSYTLTKGSLPTGLSFFSNGSINGVVPIGILGKGFDFTIQVKDSNGCEVAKEYRLDGELFIPEVFSPNGDGLNDHFMRGYKVTIFDRLGVKLFEGNDGWDGTYKGKPLPSDTYYYVLYSTENSTGKEKRYTGYIMILKR